MVQAHQDLGVKLVQAEQLIARAEAVVDARLAKFKYSEDQPRDDVGRWTDGGGGSSSVGGGDSGSTENGGIAESSKHVLYHGTSLTALSNIKQEGLKPGKPHFGRDPAVYFTSDVEIAHEIGRAWSGRLKQYAVIEITIPNDILPSVQTDNYMRDSYYLTRGVPKEWITGVTLYDRSSGSWQAVEKATSRKNKYFVVVPIVNADQSFKYKAAGYAGIRSDYRKIISTAIDDYLTSSDRATAYLSTMRQAAVEHFADAFRGGYEDGGGDPSDIDPDADGWLTDRIDQEMGFIGDLFTSLKELRAEFQAGDLTAGDLRDAAATRTDGYASSLDGVYNSGKMWGMKNKMLSWHLGSTKEHCDTCLSLDGQRHKASWYLARNYIPGKPGAAMDCHGDHCGCGLTDDEDNEVTI